MRALLLVGYVAAGAAVAGLGVWAYQVGGWRSVVWLLAGCSLGALAAVRIVRYEA